MRLIHALLVLVVPFAALAGCPPGTDDDDAISDCTVDNRPTLVIVSPDTGTQFDGGDTINWALTITDPDTDPDELDILVQDVTGSTTEDLDVTVPPPGGTGQTNFSMDADMLASGVATPVRIVVEDPDGCSVNDQILICVDYDQPPCS